MKPHKSMDPRTCEKFKFNRKNKWAEVEEQSEGRGWWAQLENWPLSEASGPP